MTNLQQLQFYATPEHPCSYLPGKQAKTLFVDPKAVIDSEDYSLLSDLGFRRSGSHLYRPHCTECHACISARVNVDKFSPSRSQRRISRLNSDLIISTNKARYIDEIYDLYERYIIARHADGDMHPPSREQFESFLVNSDQDTHFTEFHHQGQLIAVSVIDKLQLGISAIYTFFDPNLAQRSLGTFAILTQIQQARTEQLPYLYLGYWINNCRKMSYKLQFQPVELLIDNNWIELSPRQQFKSQARIKTFDL